MRVSRNRFNTISIIVTRNMGIVCIYRRITALRYNINHLIVALSYKSYMTKRHHDPALTFSFLVSAMQCLVISLIAVFLIESKVIFPSISFQYTPVPNHRDCIPSFPSQVAQRSKNRHDICTNLVYFDDCVVDW
jgi:hypothetical protein